MKQFSLDFNKAITNVPSDFICSDNELDECVNITSENGEMKPIQSPIYAATGNAALSQQETCLFVHQMPETHNLITQASTNLYYRQKGVNDSTWVADSEWISGYTIDGQITGVQSVGNTLIVATTNGLNYFIWKGNGYQQLASRIPFPKVEFMLANAHELYVGNSEWLKTENIGDLLEDVINRQTHEILKQDEWNDIVYGLMAENDEDIKKKGCFSRPFFIRYALRLYDGEYMYHSQPILVLPSITDNCYFMFQNDKIKCITHHTQLYYRVSSDYSAWSDIVAGVDVFATEQAHLYDTSVDATCSDRESSIEVWQGYGVTTGAGGVIGSSEYNRKCNETIEGALRIVKSVGDGAIEDELLTLSQFYKIADLGIGSTEDWQTLKIKPHTLENLNTQEYLKNDDFYSRCPLSAAFIKSYNGRLNMADVQRGFFLGFDNFILADNSEPGGWVIDVTISTAGGNKVVRKEVYRTKEKMLHWFYYPDARAKKVELYYGHQRYTVNLKEHPGLNGAYFLSLPDEEITTSEAADVPSWTMPSNESIPNQIITSEVNNPFVFKAEGYNAIGTGRIIGIATQTTALSQGQFGQFPLLVFSSDGIWAMSVNSTGLYQSVHPMSREVCTNNESITETDGAVFFVSEKGLMVVQGSQVQCVSKQLNGRIFNKEILPVDLQSQILYNDFEAFLAACKIAYDYRDSLLWIINTSKSFAYIYNIKSGTFSKKTFRDNPQRVVSNYPDYLIQTSPQQGNESYLFSLLHKPDQNDDTSLYGARMLTRPVTFGNILELKSISQMMNIKPFFSQNANLTTRLFASNNFKDWCELHSLRGIPWKAYRIYYDFTDLKATDRFAGTTFITESHRTNKIR